MDAELDGWKVARSDCVGSLGQKRTILALKTYEKASLQCCRADDVGRRSEVQSLCAKRVLLDRQPDYVANLAL